MTNDMSIFEDLQYLILKAVQRWCIILTYIQTSFSVFLKQKGIDKYTYRSGSLLKLSSKLDQ